MEAVNVSSHIDELRQTFRAGRTRPLAWRREQLRAIERMVTDHEERLFEALRADLGKPAAEAYGGEVGFIREEVHFTLKHLRRWTRPERVKTPLVNAIGKSEVVREPLGVVLIIGPWNYPVQLVLAPLIGAIAAGNCAVLKPSELAPHSSALLGELVPQYLDPAAVRVVEGGVPETTALLEQRFDLIFFTGSTRVGKVVMAAAAKHLTPVVLELGGKSPCIVSADVNVPTAARRIVWGKFFNTGQTCVAPDYVLVHRSVERPLIEAMGTALREFYGADPRQSPDYGRIINDAHHARLVGLLANAKVALGGEHDAAERYLAPTILEGVSPEHPVMQEEIFGPILPVLPVDSMDEAIAFVNEREKPLALYVFSNDGDDAERVLGGTSSGGACVNDTLSHLAVPDLPFGGVGESGMGAYHGRHSFEAFSHRRGVLKRWTFPDVKLRYPPYEGKLPTFKRLIG
ncbi:MAG: aldehyde dehydrogenase family protein [Planctomycetota bacterium]